MDDDLGGNFGEAPRRAVPLPWLPTREAKAKLGDKASMKDLHELRWWQKFLVIMGTSLIAAAALVLVEWLSRPTDTFSTWQAPPMPTPPLYGPSAERSALALVTYRVITKGRADIVYGLPPAKGTRRDTTLTNYSTPWAVSLQMARGDVRGSAVLIITNLSDGDSTCEVDIDGRRADVRTASGQHGRVVCDASRSAST